MRKIQNNKSTSESIVMADQAIGVIDKVMKFSEKYSIKAILNAIFKVLVIVTCCAAIYYITHPAEMITFGNKNEFVARMEANAVIRAELKNMIESTDADRAWVCEFSNGSHNSGGLPFLYCELKHYVSKEYESENIYDKYQREGTSKLPIIDYIYNEQYFSGTIDALKKIDSGLAGKLENNGTKYVVGSIITKDDGMPLAILGLSFKLLTDVDPLKIDRALIKQRHEIRSHLIVTHR